MTANDTNEEDYPGYDVRLGHGLLDAGAALAQVDKELYVLEHYQELQSNTIQIDSNITIELSEGYQAYWLNNPAGDWFQADTPLQANIYEVSYNYNLNDYPNAVVAYWPRHSSSTTFPYLDTNNVLLPRHKVLMDSTGLNTGVLKGYYYEILDDNNQTIGWLPQSLDSLTPRLEYSVLYEINGLIGVNINEKIGNSDIRIYPNPSTNTQTIHISTLTNQKVKIELYDMTGKKLKKLFENDINGEKMIQISLENLANGIYLYSIQINDEMRSIQFIKQ